jgi:hypothetical protein
MRISPVRAHEALRIAPAALNEHLLLIRCGYRLLRRARLFDYDDGHSILRLCWIRSLGSSRLVVRGTFSVIADD